MRLYSAIPPAHRDGSSPLTSAEMRVALASPSASITGPHSLQIAASRVKSTFLPAGRQPASRYTHAACHRPAVGNGTSAPPVSSRPENRGRYVPNAENV